MRLFEGPTIVAKYVHKFSSVLWGKREDPVLEKIHPDTVFWEGTGNYIFLQDAKY